jgi:hypothetical protein
MYLMSFSVATFHPYTFKYRISKKSLAQRGGRGMHAVHGGPVLLGSMDSIHSLLGWAGRMIRGGEFEGLL